MISDSRPTKAGCGDLRYGRSADVLAQVDAYNGMLLDAIDDLGIRDNTIFIFPETWVPKAALGQLGRTSSRCGRKRRSNPGRRIRTSRRNKGPRWVRAVYENQLI